MDKKIVYVTTDNDMWNSADDAFFTVLKGQVKPLPDVLTVIIEDALDQKLLREATDEEVKKWQFDNDVEAAVRNKKIVAGRKYEDTVANYRRYFEKLQSVESIEKPVEIKPEQVIINKPAGSTIVK